MGSNNLEKPVFPLIINNDSKTHPQPPPPLRGGVIVFNSTDPYPRLLTSIYNLWTQ